LGGHAVLEVCIEWAIELVQEVRGTEPAGEYTFVYGKGYENHELGTGFLCVRESYQQLRELSLLVIGCHT
jgi:hypothetical protein